MLIKSDRELGSYLAQIGILEGENSRLDLVCSGRQIGTNLHYSADQAFLYFLNEDGEHAEQLVLELRGDDIAVVTDGVWTLVGRIPKQPNSIGGILDDPQLARELAEDLTTGEHHRRALARV